MAEALDATPVFASLDPLVDPSRGRMSSGPFLGRPVAKSWELLRTTSATAREARRISIVGLRPDAAGRRPKLGLRVKVATVGRLR